MARSLLRRAAVVTFAGALICFCSCERHRASEQAHGGDQAKTEVAGDKKGHRKSEKAAHGGTQSRATTATSVTPAPASPSPTPANFFPTASPH